MSTLRLMAATLLAAGTCMAQNDPKKEDTPKRAEAIKYYHLDFVVKEIDDSHVINSRTYSITVSTELRNSESLRTGSKVPVETSGSGQFTYLDVGVNIDCREVQELGQYLTILVTADISSTAQLTSETTVAHVPPIIRNNRWSSPVIVPLRSPTIIFSSDDVSSKHKMQVQLTASPIPT